MAKRQLRRLIENLDRLGSSAVLSGPSRIAKRTIQELQQEGPSWTGRFSNSWVIETPDGRVFKGDGAEGEPRPIKLPLGLLTGRQNLKGSLPFKNRAVTSIYNFSPWVEQATDKKEDFFERPTEQPETALGRRKWEIHQGESGRPQPGRRGDVPSPLGRNDTGKSSRTADLDWFATYVTTKLDRAVQIEMDKMFKSLPRS